MASSEVVTENEMESKNADKEIVGKLEITLMNCRLKEFEVEKNDDVDLLDLILTDQVNMSCPMHITSKWKEMRLKDSGIQEFV